LEGFCASFTGWLAISSVGVVVLTPNETLVSVFEVSAAGVATDVVSDVAAERRGSGCAMGLRGVKWGGLGRLGRVCRRLDGTGCLSRVLPTDFVITGCCDVAAATVVSGREMGVRRVRCGPVN
jgi:hypothetical protein